MSLLILLGIEVEDEEFELDGTIGDNCELPIGDISFEASRTYLFSFF